MNHITFTKIKQWYLPVAAEDYKALRALGVPLLRVHQNFLPTLSLITKGHDYSGRLVSFKDDILNPYLDNLGQKWQQSQSRKCSISASVLKFEARLEPKNVEAFTKLEASLRKFFVRWGYSASFDYSETRGKGKLHIQYKYDSKKSPVIVLKEDSTSLPAIKLEIGFVRLTLTLGEKEIETNIAISAGGQWSSLHTSRCLYTQVSDVRPMVASLMAIVDKDQHNFENHHA